MKLEKYIIEMQSVGPKDEKDWYCEDTLDNVEVKWKY